LMTAYDGPVAQLDRASAF